MYKSLNALICSLIVVLSVSILIQYPLIALPVPATVRVSQLFYANL